MPARRLVHHAQTW